MSAGTRIVRLVTGTLLVVAVVVGIFVPLRSWALTWGATEAEVQRTLPGDELIERSVIDWNHAATIDAPPEKVWPWIAQMGDERGGFYSYTFIENLLQKMAGGEAVYHNASDVLPHLQDPQPGEGMVMDSLRVHDIEPGKWLLATQTSEQGDYQWVWLWHLEPVGTDQARLLVRNVLRLPGAGDNPVASTVLDLGGYVMERRMIEGIKLRAEGRREPAGIEVMEIALWAAALASGLGAAVLLVVRRAWQAPLLLGLAGLLALIWFTFWLPPLWLRLVLDAILLALLGWVARSTRRHAAAQRN